MKKGIIYYLRKNRTVTFYTSKPPNTRAVIDVIDNNSNFVYGHYIDYKDDIFNGFTVCKHEFFEIFSKKPYVEIYEFDVLRKK